MPIGTDRATRSTSTPGRTRLATFLSRGAAAGMLVLPVALPAGAADCDPGIFEHIKGNTVLPPNCTYRTAIRITDSNTVLDCRGSSFIGSAGEKIGLMIDSEGKPLSDVTVKNCKFSNFASSGVRVTWDKPDAKKGSDHDEIYRRSPARIVLDNIVVQDNGRVGIYLDDYVSDVTIKNSSVIRSGAAGIYLEHSSRRIKLIGNKILGNGRATKREGVAVDSSADNVIEDNVFQGNAAGGIFLYKNCGEHFSTGKQVIRWQHSDRNLIKGNTFIDENTGIWLASRQHRDLSRWDCGDAPLNGKGRFADFADSNTVENNSFCRTAVTVVDDGKDNEIKGSKSFCPAAAVDKN